MAVDKTSVQKLLDQIEQLTGKKIQLNLDTKTPEELGQIFDKYEEKLNNARQGSQFLNMSLQETRDLSKAIVQEMTQQNIAVNAARTSMKGLTNIASELLNEEREISSLSEDRLETLAEQAKLRKQTLEDQADFLKRDDESYQQALRRLKLEERSLDLKTKDGKKEAKRIANEKTILRAALDAEGIYKRIVDLADERLSLEQATTKSFGLSGAALSAASTIAGKFGMSHVSKELDTIKDKLKTEIREEVAKNNGEALSFGKRFQFAGKAIGQTAKVLAKGMMDPLFLIGKIFTAFLDVNKAAVDFTRLTGQNATAVSGLNSRLATSVDFLETAAELTRQIGMSATGIFGPDEIGAMAEAKNLLGLSAEQAGNLGIRSKVAGVNIDQYKEGIVAATNQYNKANKSVVAHGLVLQDVLNTSDSIALSVGAQPGALAKAAAAARSLGMELSKVDDIAGSLMNFESSIEAELEAQLLTSKNINLAKARELALNNDLAGLSAELAKNGASAAEFSKMNRIQQESLAKALGMSRDELGKMAQQELLRAGASLEAQAAARGVSVEMMEQMNIQDRIQKSLDKLAQAFAPILDAVIPIVEALLIPVQYLAKAVAYTLQWTPALNAVKLIAGGIAGYFARKQLRSFFKAGIEGAKAMYASLLRVFTLQKTMKAAQIGASSPWSPTQAAQQSAPKPSAMGGKGGGGMMQSMSRINTTALLKGAAAMAIAAGAVYIFGKAVQELEKVEDYGRVAIGLGLFVGTMGATAAILYFAGPAFAAAAPVLLAFGAAVTLFGLGLNLATPAIEAFGNAATSVLGGIKGLLEVITPASALGLMMMGPALGSLAFGLTALGASALFALPGIGVLSALSLLGPGLALAGDGIAVMAENMNKLVTALNNLEVEKIKELKNLVLTTAFAAPAVAATGAITELINGITGTGSNESDNKEILNKLDQVVNVISNIKGDVIIDGEVAGAAIFRNTLRR